MLRFKQIEPMAGFSRRAFLGAAGWAAGLALAAGGLPRLAFANVASEQRLLLIFLRGGLDSLSTVVPYADPHYASLRGALAYPAREEKLIALDAFYALNAALPTLAELYRKQELAIVHAVATPYRERSHFDAQNLLENGSAAPHALNSGWLNRALGVLGGGTQALAVGPTVPLLLRGEAEVMSWSPSMLATPDEDLLARIATLYAHDPLLGEALRVAGEQQAMAGSAAGSTRLRGAEAFVGMMKSAAGFLGKPDGPRIATLDFDGFDTHVRQQGEGPGGGRLPAQLKALDAGLRGYRESTPAAVWRSTVIYVVTEFGRTVRPNGSGGTDHGTASMALLMGGAVQGGRVIAQWPGLAENRLYQGRDLQPTTDLRAVSKHLLMAHYQIPSAVIDRHILPGSAALAPVEVLRT